MPIFGRLLFSKVVESECVFCMSELIASLLKQNSVSSNNEVVKRLHLRTGIT